MRKPNQRSQLTIESLVNDQVLDEAWAWLCRRQKDKALTIPQAHTAL